MAIDLTETSQVNIIKKIKKQERKNSIDTKALKEKKKNTPDSLACLLYSVNIYKEISIGVFFFFSSSSSIFVSHYNHRGSRIGVTVFMMIFFFFLGTIDIQCSKYLCFRKYHSRSQILCLHAPTPSVRPVNCPSTKSETKRTQMQSF